MTDTQPTRPSLLLRIRDVQDAQAWGQFAEIYAPLLHRFACKNGLQEADAADLTQDVLSGVAKSIGGFDYDPQVGRFRSWLFTVARNKLNNQLAKQMRQPRGTGDTMMHEVINNQSAGDDELAKMWEEEYEHRLFHWAAEKVQGQFRDATWQAFWQTAVEDRGAPEVAKQLGISVGAVYIAKSRVTAKLKEQIALVGDR